jgi:hypothetical protein
MEKIIEQLEEVTNTIQDVCVELQKNNRTQDAQALLSVMQKIQSVLMNLYLA